MVLAQEVARDARALAKEVHAKLHEYAPDALRTIKALADDPDISPAVRLKASEILLRHSGLSLEKSGDVNLTVNLSAPNAAEVVRTRLDRLAATPPVIAGELDHPPN